MANRKDALVDIEDNLDGVMYRLHAIDMAAYSIDDSDKASAIGAVVIDALKYLESAQSAIELLRQEAEEGGAA